jgi:glycosyltransferase involved in cell wall biosynthesis
MNIVFITDRSGFPNGLASTPRVKMYVRGLKNAGVNSQILVTRYSEIKSPPINTELKGNYQGIPFEYTSPTTIRPKQFLKRRQIELLSYWRTYIRLKEMKKNGNLDCIYYYSDILYPYPDQYLYSFLAKTLHVPFVLELCECPWSLLKKYKNPLNISPLWGVNGVISISKFLSDWVKEEKQKRKYSIAAIEIPILADVNEQTPKAFPSNNHSVLFAASSAYIHSMVFMTNAMEYVWDEIPNSKLYITGIRQTDIKDQAFIKRYESLKNSNNMEICGYLPRIDLLDLFGNMNALLIPLFNDIYSKARFPTKIGEYLLAERPIITTRVGEIPRFFFDQKNAYMTLAEDSKMYGEKIIYALKNKEVSRSVGIEGRKLAFEKFDYRLYSETLKSFFESVIQNYA